MKNIVGFIFFIAMAIMSVTALDGDATVSIMCLFFAFAEIVDFCEKVKAVEKRKRARR